MPEPVRIAVLISGRGSNMAALVEATSPAYEVVLVASDRPDAGGLAFAAERGIATWALSPKGIGKPAHEAALDEALRRAGVEVIALAGYMRLLSDAFVARWRGRVVNIHPSLLPKYKGLDTHARALAAGDAAAGCSVHLVTEELDGGRVLGQAEIAILPGDTPDVLAARVLAEEHKLYPRVLTEFVTSMTPSPLDRLRALALQLPGAHEDAPGRFAVEGERFAELAGGTLQFRADDGWSETPLADVDWQAVEDRVAHAWELTAPTGLLEAGGR